MLDIQFIIHHSEQVKASIQARQLNVDLDQLIVLYQQLKTLKLTLDNKRAAANNIAKQLSTTDLKEHTDERIAEIAVGRQLKQEISLLEAEVRQLTENFNALMLTIPNILAADTPPGSSDLDNLVVSSYLTPPIFNFAVKDHVELGNSLQLIDFEAGSKVTGSKFYFLKNEAVLLELALKLFAFQLAIKHGYTPLITPDLVKNSIMTGTGFVPRGAESNIYNLAELDLSLIATAEIPIAGLHAEEFLEEGSLPLKYVAESHCFRREAGAAGQESKGLYRVHQFSKIELFQITQPTIAEAALEEILQLEELIYRLLELPYRVVRVCAADLGAPAYKKYDIEVWMPGKTTASKYGEVTSASNCTDYQARRLNIKYRTKQKQKIYPYTLNGTAIALSRTLIAILENYQQQDGSVLIPTVLRPYLGLTCLYPKCK